MEKITQHVFDQLLIKNMLKQTKFEDKTVKSTQPSLVLIGLHEAWKRETYVRSQSFSSEWAVKYLHVGRKKIQISLPPGEQDQSNALPQGQQRQSNPHPMPPYALPPPPSPPRWLYIDRCIILSGLDWDNVPFNGISLKT